MSIFKKIVYNHRIKKAIKKWTDDVSLIAVMAKHNEDGCFKWGQLVWQEIWMYAKLREQVDPKEFYELCKRRGFDQFMSEYLRIMLKHIGIGKLLDDQICECEQQSNHPNDCAIQHNTI